MDEEQYRRLRVDFHNAFLHCECLRWRISYCGKCEEILKEMRWIEDKLEEMKRE